MRLQQQAAAGKTCEEGLQRFPGNPELLFRRAMLHHASGRFSAAIEDYLTILKPQTDRHFSSRDVGILGYKARHNLALVYEDVGQPDKAIAEWREILKERPDYDAALAALRKLELTHVDSLC